MTCKYCKQTIFTTTTRVVKNKVVTKCDPCWSKSEKKPRTFGASVTHHGER